MPETNVATDEVVEDVYDKDAIVEEDECIIGVNDDDDDEGDEDSTEEVEGETSTDTNTEKSSAKRRKYLDDWNVYSAEDGEVIPTSTKDRQTFALEMLSCEGYSITDFAFRWNTLYVATLTHDEKLDKDVIVGAVIYLKWYDDEVHYQVVYETDSPEDVDCPARIVKKLSTEIVEGAEEYEEPEHALNWRERVMFSKGKVYAVPTNTVEIETDGTIEQENEDNEAEDTV